MLFQRDTRSKTKTVKKLAYLEHYSVVRLTQKTAKKKRKLSSSISALVGDFAKPSAVLTRTATE
jgi:hypothetical protein